MSAVEYLPAQADDEPSSLVAVHDQCASVERWAADCQSVPELRDASNKLAAIDQYLARTSKEGRARVAAAMRRLEARIGEVLGPREQGKRPDPLLSRDQEVSNVAQRDLNQARVDKIAANFDPEHLGTPTVNERDGHFYVIDGQHRIEALRQIGWGDQQIQAWTYVGLSETEEAEKFDRLNDVLAVNAYDKFRVRVAAGRAIETDIDRTVRAQGLVVSKDKVPGAIRAVGTLTKVYTRSDAGTLGRTLRIIRDAYGDPGLEAAVVDGIAHLCQRYNGELDEAIAVKKLAGVHGGVNGLLGKAEILRKQTGNYKSHCVAAAAVEIINAGRGGKKLPGWWSA